MDKRKAITVVIIDDHKLFRDGLESLLRNRGILVKGSAGTGEEGVELVRLFAPSAVLLDIRMPGMGGIATLRALAVETRAPVVMLTTSADRRDVNAAVRAGAAGYFLKDMNPDDLVVELKNIVCGQDAKLPALSAANERDGGAGSSADTGGLEKLTPRETEILELVADGLSNKAIAKRLGIADGTVKMHVKALLKKLGVHSRVEAAVIAVENNVRRPT